MLLTVAGIFLIFALIAYLVGEMQQKIQRDEAIRHQNGQRVQEEQWNQERARLYSQSEQTRQERAALLDQYKTIVQSLRRIETAVEPASK